jgi:hypothetical protein
MREWLEGRPLPHNCAMGFQRFTTNRRASEQQRQTQAAVTPQVERQGQPDGNRFKTATAGPAGQAGGATRTALGALYKSDSLLAGLHLPGGSDDAQECARRSCCHKSFTFQSAYGVVQGKGRIGDQSPPEKTPESRAQSRPKLRLGETYAGVFSLAFSSSRQGCRPGRSLLPVALVARGYVAR